MQTVIHLIYRFDIGGLEKVMADTINELDEFKHIIICLTFATSESKNLLKDNVRVIELHKKNGHDASIWIKLFKLFRSIKPTILHSYNLPTIEYQLLGFLCRIPNRIHAEHGRNASDPVGKNSKYRLLRQILNPLIHSWVPVSKDLAYWLINKIGIADKKVHLIHNGIDTSFFTPHANTHKQIVLENFANENDFVIGTIGRIDPVKNQHFLIQIYKEIINQLPEAKESIKFVIVGSGPLLDTLASDINADHLNEIFWLPGARYNIKELLNSFDIFVLPSITEGIPMTVLEAMSVAKPVIASNVGGLPELITDNSGHLLPPDDPKLWAQIIIDLYQSKAKREMTGINARKHVNQYFSLSSMIGLYRQLYTV